MAITPLTGFKALTFDGEKSTDYGVAILGEGVFNAPKRDVDMVTIPGRSGQFAMDNGRFENIEVTYPANLIANNEADFADALSDFRNMLCSKRGYVRLQDDYHPDEYRMAVYKEGLDVDEKVLKAGEFKLKFDCKPQRWLTSGETAVTVTSGDALTNPTLFDAHPLIECKGYGTIRINSEQIQVASVPIGDVVVSNGKSFYLDNFTETTPIHSTTTVGSVTIDDSKLNSGDSIYVAELQLSFNIMDQRYNFDTTSVSSESGESWSTVSGIASAHSIYFNTTIKPQTFTKGTASTKTYEYELHWEASSGGVTYTQIMTVKVSYNGSRTITLSSSTIEDSNGETHSISAYIGQVSGYSTKVMTGTRYIDLDVGEAYFIDSGQYISANYGVTIPPKLPVLKPGNNTITYDNTITNFKVTPRWWKV